MFERWRGGTGEWDPNQVVGRRPRRLWRSTFTLIAAIAVLAVALAFSRGLITVPGFGSQTSSTVVGSPPNGEE